MSGLLAIEVAAFQMRHWVEKHTESSVWDIIQKSLRFYVLVAADTDDFIVMVDLPPDGGMLYCSLSVKEGRT